MRVRTSTGLRKLADNRAEKVGLTRFFHNPRVTVDEILGTAAARTGAAAAGRRVQRAALTANRIQCVRTLARKGRGEKCP